MCVDRATGPKAAEQAPLYHSPPLFGRSKATALPFGRSKATALPFDRSKASALPFDRSKASALL